MSHFDGVHFCFSKIHPGKLGQLKAFKFSKQHRPSLPSLTRLSSSHPLPHEKELLPALLLLVWGDELGAPLPFGGCGQEEKKTNTTMI